MGKAQGTIEYLVVLAVIVIISLVVVGLVSSTTNPEQISSSTGKISNLTQGGISIADALVSSGGDGLISLQNNSGDLLTITSISFGGIDNNYNQQLASGSKILFSLDDLAGVCTCLGYEGKIRTCSAKIFYTTSDGLQKSDTYSVSVECAASALAADLNKVTTPLDTNAPRVSLTSPATDYLAPARIVDFSFYVTDNNSVSSCKLVLDGVNVSTLSSVSNNSSNTISHNISNLTVQSHSWDVNCIDFHGNSALSGSSRTFTLGGLSTPFVWLSNVNSGSVSKLHDSNGGLIGSYSVGNNSIGVAVDSNGDAWVAGGGVGGGVAKINGLTGSLIGNYTAGSNSYGVAVDASDNVWVANAYGGNVSKINGATGALIDNYSVGPVPKAVAVDASNHVWITNSDDSTITELNVSDGSLVGTYSAGGVGGNGVAVDGDGNIWVAGGSGVAKLNGTTGDLIETFSPCTNPTGVAVDANNNVWVACMYSDAVARYNASDNSFIGTYSAGATSNPVGISIDGNGSIWVSNATRAAVKLDGSTGEIIVTAAVGGYGFGDATGFALQYFVLGKR